MYIIGLYIILASVDYNLAQSANIRLVNGRQDGSDGRLEVYHNGTWGTVCDDNFDNNASNVVCHMLGYTGDVFISRGKAHYGRGIGQIWLDEVTCHGNETSLFNCRKSNWGQTNCGHNEDVGVDCDPAQNIRLVNGTRQDGSNGRLEVLHGGLWGTVCDDLFDSNAAKVVCHMLGYTGHVFLSRIKAQFGRGTGTIWLDDVTCHGNETNLLNCRKSNWGMTNCDHAEDVGVDCDPDRDAYLPLRLVNGPNSNEGRVEVQHGVNGTWGTICDDEWDDKAALVVCKQITGLDENSITATSVKEGGFGQGQGVIWLDYVRCTGLEAGLGACSHTQWGQTYCDHSEDVGVRCQLKHDIDECLSSPCRNGATCTDGIGYFNCTCATGWTGQRCETDFDECSSSPCRNGAVCTDGIGQFNCTCTTGWTGQHCETAVSSGELMCFVCDYTTTLSYCDSVQKCQPNQLCFVERSKNSNGHIHFRSGCQDKHTCSIHNQKLGGLLDDTCIECCDGDFCNSGGCGDIGFPLKQSRGPICLDCAFGSNPMECDRVTICDSDELCHIEELQWGSNSLFHLGCKSNNECAFETRSLTGNTRELVQRAVPMCRTCCQGDFCNRNCTRHINSNHIIVG